MKVISEAEQTPFLDPLVSKFNYFGNGTAQLRTALMISWKYKRDFKRVLTSLYLTAPAPLNTVSQIQLRKQKLGSLSNSTQMLPLQNVCTANKIKYFRPRLELIFLEP